MSRLLCLGAALVCGCIPIPQPTKQAESAVRPNPTHVLRVWTHEVETPWVVYDRNAAEGNAKFLGKTVEYVLDSGEIQGVPNSYYIGHNVYVFRFAPEETPKLEGLPQPHGWLLVRGVCQGKVASFNHLGWIIEFAGCQLVAEMWPGKDGQPVEKRKF